MRYELKIALRYLRARRKDAFISITTLFTGVGVMIGVAALIVTLSVMGGFEESLKRRVLALTPQVQILSGAGTISDYAKIQRAVAMVDGVRSCDPFTVSQAMVSTGRGVGGAVVRGVVPDSATMTDQWARYVTAGKMSRLADAPRAWNGSDAPVSNAAIGAGMARKLKVRVGDQIRLVAPIMTGDAAAALSTKSGDFTVCAIFESGMTFPDNDLVFIELKRAQEFFGRGASVNGIDVRLASLDKTVAVTNAVARAIAPPLVVRNWMDYNRSATAGFEMLKRVYSLVLMLLIGVAAFNLVATLIMVVMEKRKDIAVLMTLGATRREVRLIFVLKGLVVGGAGTLGGLLLGAIGCFVLSRYQVISIPREIYGISTVPIAVDPINFVVVAIASLALCLVATFYPARQASREVPADVLRT
ncbi:MAG: FtsX-like permease family protein [Candidatus Binataceae bacterium]